MFLTKTEIHKQAKQEINIETLDSKCGKCNLYKDCKSSKMEYSGKGEKGILIIGDTPSNVDDQKAIQFADEAGEYLSELFQKNRISLNRDCWKVNAVRCNNGLKELGRAAKLCSGYINKLLYTLKPKAVLILGQAGISSIFHEDFSNRILNRWRGFIFPDEKFKTNFFCTYHPREVLEQRFNVTKKTLFERDIDFFFDNYLNSTEYIDNYESRVTHITEYNKVIQLLERVLREKRAIYFDYETSGLKPFKSGHFIASIAFAFSSKEAYAFPFDYNNFWTSQQREAIKVIWIKILQEVKIHKLAHNLKFEDFWSNIILSSKVHGWNFDTMMTAHILDNRKAFTALKFQTFINFGVRPYDKHIAPLLKGNEQGFNNVHKIPLKELLTYNGLDCVFGWMLHDKQIAQLAEKKGLTHANNFFFKSNLAMARLQLQGIPTNIPYFKKQKDSLTFRINKIKRELTRGREARAFHKTFNRYINVNSNADLGMLFYEVLGKPVVYTDNGNYKVDKKTLASLNLPFADNLLDGRRLTKARDTYLAQFFRETYEGFMYPFFNLHVVVSYRSSSSEPNFQNLPKRDKEIMKLIRSGIIPIDDYVISETDFSGAEVITSACYHKDPTFIAYLLDKSTDMHRDLALDIWKLDRSELENPNFTREQQAKAKDIRFYAKNNWTFAQFYGDWYESCAKMLWENCIENNKLVLPSGVKLIDHAKAQGIGDLESFIEHCKAVEESMWNERFPVYTQWKKKIVKFYLKHGYIETFLGFRFQGLMDRKQCCNYPIQGTSFHMLLYTLLEVEKFLAKNKMKTRLIGQIHDSIIALVHKDEVEFYHRGISAIISNLKNVFSWLVVPMEAECSISKLKQNGGNFADLYEIKPKYLNGEAEFNLDEIYGLNVEKVHGKAA